TLENKVDIIDNRLGTLENKVDIIDNRLGTLENRVDKVESQVSTLTQGQIELRKEVDEINIKVSKTYDLALYAWGKSTENRHWLENERLLKA
ncbi:MAG: hypothetical protein NC307_05725, partial [Roseburia sp.]|nr:hypothetical protein [Roseburia sp.]